jgi:alkylation response protein AidB-like acyl-CoA dehydrogenase
MGHWDDTRTAAWLDALGRRGWIAAAWPREYGGADLSVLEQFVLTQEITSAGAPTSRRMLNLVGPTIMLHGTAEQRATYLPPMLRGETAWCQGFSEPGAGSDLASLRTSAVRQGDDYVVNGQKIWTSGAHESDWMFMLVRTDGNAPKHRGISYLLVDMKSPGISVRPLLSLDGGHWFNEVFFEDVRVPLANRVGAENGGWYVATATLDFERSNIALAMTAKRSLQRLAGYLTARGNSASKGHRFEVADRWVETSVSELLSLVVVAMQAAGDVPNMEASRCKMYGTELWQRLAQTRMRLSGMKGQLRTPDGLEREFGIHSAAEYMNTLTTTIAGGTSEIQRNIIATRGLGMPRG